MRSITVELNVPTDSGQDAFRIVRESLRLFGAGAEVVHAWAGHVAQPFPGEDRDSAPPKRRVTDQEEYVQRVEALTAQFRRKNFDYGSSFAVPVMGVPASACNMVRLFDKVKRIDTLMGRGGQAAVAGESVSDTLGDLHVCAVLVQMCLAREKGTPAERFWDVLADFNRSVAAASRSVPDAVESLHGEAGCPGEAPAR